MGCGPAKQASPKSKMGSENALPDQMPQNFQQYEAEPEKATSLEESASDGGGGSNCRQAGHGWRANALHTMYCPVCHEGLDVDKLMAESRAPPAQKQAVRESFAAATPRTADAESDAEPQPPDFANKPAEAVQGKKPVEENADQEKNVAKTPTEALSEKNASSKGKDQKPVPDPGAPSAEVAEKNLQQEGQATEDSTIKEKDTMDTSQPTEGSSDAPKIVKKKMGKSPKTPSTKSDPTEPEPSLQSTEMTKVDLTAEASAGGERKSPLRGVLSCNNCGSCIACLDGKKAEVPADGKTAEETLTTTQESDDSFGMGAHSVFFPGKLNATWRELRRYDNWKNGRFSPSAAREEDPFVTAASGTRDAGPGRCGKSCQGHLLPAQHSYRVDESRDPDAPGQQQSLPASRDLPYGRRLSNRDGPRAVPMGEVTLYNKH